MILSSERLDAAWRKTMFAILWRGGLAILVMAYPLASTIWLYRRLDGGLTTSKMWTQLVAHLLPIAFMTAWAIVPILRRFRQIKQMRQLPATLCPPCDRPLRPTDDCGACSCCLRTYRTPWLREYWSAALCRRIARQWQIRHSQRGLPAMFRHERVGFGIGVLVVLIMAVGVSHFLPRLNYAVSSPFMSLAGMMVGMTGLMFASNRRRGDFQFCRRCRYRTAPGEPELERCSECGAEWLEPGGLLHGSPRPMLWILALAGLVTFAPMTIESMRIIRPMAFVRMQSTESLIENSVTGNVFHRDKNWAAFFQRGPSSQDKVQLAAAILDARDDGDFESTMGRLGWLETYCHPTGSAPADLADRYYRGSAQLKLVTDDEIVSGSEVTVSILTAVMDASATWRIYAISAGPTVDGHPEFVSSSMPEAVEIDDLGRLVDNEEVRHLLNRPDRFAVDNGPTLRFTPPRAGTYTIRCRVWLIAIDGIKKTGLRGYPTNPITFDAEGELVLPDNAIRTDAIDLETTITIDSPTPAGS